MNLNHDPGGGRFAWLATQRYAILLGALALRLVTVPVVEAVVEGGWSAAGMAAQGLQWLLLVFACVLAIGRGRTLVVLAVAAITALVLEGIDAYWGGETVAEAGKAIFSCTLIVWAIVHLLSRTFSATVIRASDLHAAAAIYLLIGFAFASAYQFIGIVWPQAFNLPANAGDAKDIFIYFSFITLATVGYGDVTPVGGIPRMLAVLEAVTGQIYLVVSVSRLVGLHVAQKTPRDGDR